MNRAFPYHATVLATAFLVLGANTGAQEEAPRPKDVPAADQELSPIPQNAPAPAQEAEAETKESPAANQGAAPEPTSPSVPVQEAVSEPKEAPAANQEAAPGPTDGPAPTQESAAERKAAPSSEKAADADRHTPKPVKSAEPDHFRGQVVSVQDAAMVIKTREGKSIRIGIPDGATILVLSKGSFSSVDFGTYVGAVGVKLEEFSPIVRDSAVWLHKGFELRIIDEQLRGIALGHKRWDLTKDSIISHGWVDDIEVRVLSIKWGPSDYDETDMEVPRDAPVHKMTLGDRSMIRPGSHVLAGVQKGSDGKYAAAFVFIGKDGVVPAL